MEFEEVMAREKPIVPIEAWDAVIGWRDDDDEEEKDECMCFVDEYGEVDLCEVCKGYGRNEEYEKMCEGLLERIRASEEQFYRDAEEHLESLKADGAAVFRDVEG